MKKKTIKKIIHYYMQYFITNINDTNSILLVLRNNINLKLSQEKKLNNNICGLINSSVK